MQANHRFRVGDRLTLIKSLEGFPVGTLAEVNKISYGEVELLFPQAKIVGNYSANLVQSYFTLPLDFYHRSPDAIIDTRK